MLPLQPLRYPETCRTSWGPGDHVLAAGDNQFARRETSFWTFRCYRFTRTGSTIRAGTSWGPQYQSSVFCGFRSSTFRVFSTWGTGTHFGVRVSRAEGHQATFRCRCEHRGAGGPFDPEAYYVCGFLHETHAFLSKLSSSRRC